MTEMREYDAAEALDEEYGMSVSPAVASVLYGSEDGFVESVDSGETALYENGSMVGLQPSSALALRKAVMSA